MMKVYFAVMVTLTFSWPMAASAQSTPSPAPVGTPATPPTTPTAIKRNGWAGGLTVGSGYSYTSGSGFGDRAGLASSGDVGYVTRGGWGIFIDTSDNRFLSSDSQGSSLQATDTVLTIEGRGWFEGRFWYALGLGIGWQELSGDVLQPNGTFVHFDGTGDTRFASIGALGVEAYQGRHFALDVQLRDAAVSYGDPVGTVHDVTLLIGVNWYARRR